jgi:regulation of enolase protein 1 (concanavalin A-like superfamily)
MTVRTCAFGQVSAWVILLPLLGSVAAAASWNPSTWSATDVGNPSPAGATQAGAESVILTAAGNGIGGRSDQCQFSATTVAGDFDIQVRVVSLKNTDLWAKAGLMIRAGLTPEATFAGVFATPSGAGCAFQSRDVAAGAATYQGFFPANQPFAWLRLRRQGDLLSGYASYDGRRWTILGSKTITFGADAIIGLAATSHSTNVTRAEFRDLTDVVDAVAAQTPVEVEPIGPCSRRTALVISEIMYHPAARADGRNLEFVEVYNGQPYYEDISGWKLDGDITFTFPSGTIIPGGGFLVVAAVPDDLRAVCSLDTVLGPFKGKLANQGGKIRLLGDRDAVLLEIEYNDKAPWPELADGAGHSLALVRPSYGEADARAWAASRVKGGSPGRPEAVEFTSTSGVRINECQMPDSSGAGFVELFNASSVVANLAGVRLGPAFDELPFRAPDGTVLPAGGYVQFTWAQLGFRPDPKGDTIFLESADGSRFLDAVTFGPQTPGTSTGRWPNGARRIAVLPQPTSGAANIRPCSDIVINEICHSPLSGDANEEFVELYNSGSASVDISGWQFTQGIEFTFAQGSTLAPGGYLVVAHNAARFHELHPTANSASVVGDFKGKLSGKTEQLVLSRPISVSVGGKSETALAAVVDAAYAGSGRWSRWSDQGGSTLERIDPRSDGALPSSWSDSRETERAGWTTVEFTGVLDNGARGGGGFGGGPGRPPGGGGTSLGPDSLHILLLGEGECLIDNVEVIGPGNTNRIANGTFEQGITSWTFSGNHVRSSLESTQGYESTQSLHLRASGNGDTGANKIFVKLTPALTNGNTATLRARVKWLSGFPEILLRLHGNSLEAFGRLQTPAAPGTPGARNSVALANAGPGFGRVQHFPVVPAIDEPVTVTAELDDPDGIQAVTLRYRVDPGTAQATVAMNDNGKDGDAVAGDGIYSGIIPAPGAAKLIAFTIQAADGAAASAGSVFPPSSAGQECLVRFGDGTPSGAFGTYRLWVTQANSDAWKNRPVLSNEPIESTFVYGNVRAVYNAGGRFAGSPYHQQFNSGPASQAHFTIDLPKDDQILGASSLNKLHAPGNGAFDDNTLQREQIAYWLARKSGQPWLHRRYFHFYVNGARKQNLMEDTQVGNDDLVQEFWPQDDQGPLYKMQPWFEFTDAVSQNLNMQSSTFVSIDRFVTTSNQLKLARYRWNWLVRGAETTANDYTNVLEFINVATDWSNAAYAQKVETLVDVDEWMRFFAINHAIGNWDSIGYRNAQNTYSYKPRNGRWQLIIWDANIVLGGGGSDGPSNLPLFTTSDPTFSRWFTQTAFRRRLLTAYYNLVNGPMQTSLIAPMLDAKYAAFTEHGVTATAPDVIKTWITGARNYILAQINKESAAFAVVDPEVGQTLELAGTGPLDMVALQVNGTAVPVSWTSTKAWTASVANAGQAASWTVAALNSAGAVITGAERTVTVTAPGVLNIAHAADQLTFQYHAARAGVYQLQAVTALVGGVWETVATTDATVGDITFRIARPAGTTLFYRVVEP